jgi:copper/silver efflux system protein
VGIIALLGLDAETSLIMLLYLDNSFQRAESEGRLRSLDEVWEAVYHGAVMRIRPKTMTVLTTILGLLPLMFATGAGADTMRRLAAPMIGGLVTSFVLELLIYPAVYFMARSYQWRRRAG